MARELNTKVLDQAARNYAAAWVQPNRRNKRDTKWIGGPEWVLQDFYNFTYKDVFEYVLAKFKGFLGPESLREFEALAAERFTPRSDEVFADLLKQNLAIDVDGNHIPGAIGRIEVGRRTVGTRLNAGRDADATWPIYAGEEEERAAGSDVPDPLPEFRHFARDEHLDPI